MPTGFEIKSILHSRGVDIIEFVDISHLPGEQNKGFPGAILLEILLSPAYLTNAPVETARKNLLPARCGDCEVCMNVCDIMALRGRTWEPGISSDEMLDADLCSSCLKCMVFCPLTLSYSTRKRKDI